MILQLNQVFALHKADTYGSFDAGTDVLTGRRISHSQAPDTDIPLAFYAAPLISSYLGLAGVEGKLLVSYWVSSRELETKATPHTYRTTPKPQEKVGNC